MSHSLPQYYENTLTPLPITKETLEQVIREFADYATTAQQIINAGAKNPESNDITEYGTIFNGYIGDYLSGLPRSPY